MNDTGIVRRVDDLGRIVIPMELRRTHQMAIFVDGERIILQKHNDVCSICGSPDEIERIKDRPVCADCVKTIKAK